MVNSLGEAPPPGSLESTLGQVVFADSRRFAEEWTYRFLAAALADAIPEGSG